MKLSEHITIIKRGAVMLWNDCPRHIWSRFFDTIINALLPYIPLYFSAKLIDALTVGAPVGTLALYVALTVGLVFVVKLAGSYLERIRSSTSMDAYRAEQWRYSKKAMDMAYESIEEREVSLLRERIRAESQTGFNRYALIYSLENAIHHITTVIASVAMTISFFCVEAIPLYMKLGIVVLAVLTILCGMVTTSHCEKIEHKFWSDCVEMNVLSDKYYEYVDDYSAGKDVRLYSMDADLAERMAALEWEFYDKQIKNANKQTLLTLPTTFLGEIFRFAGYAVMIYAALAGGITVGSIAKYMSCIAMLLGALSGLVSNVQYMLNNNTYLKRYFSYFDIPNNMYKGSLTVEKRDDREYYVEFRDVSFKYPNSDIYALRHVNVKFRVGEKLAVVGMNGSGKTTFIKLMCRLYDPTEGEILLNGVNIQKYDYDEYMSIFSVVFQDFRLFAFSLGQNVAASDKYDRARVEECLREAGFGDRLETLPDGTETYLYKDYSDDGIEISGGEAQKIAIARALYKNAPFIILDEPTAALDPVAEYEVYSKFNDIVGDRTAIYISHRLASCRFCDNIVVFDHGGIVQHGSHDELLADETGKYCELWNAQAQYYEEKK